MTMIKPLNTSKLRAWYIGTKGQIEQFIKEMREEFNNRNEKLHRENRVYFQGYRDINYENRKIVR